jgi:hypothetical protein
MNSNLFYKFKLFYYVNIPSLLHWRPTPVPPHMSLIQLLKKGLPDLFGGVPRYR